MELSIEPAEPLDLTLIAEHPDGAFADEVVSDEQVPVPANDTPELAEPVAVDTSNQVITRLDQAQNLPELPSDQDEHAHPVCASVSAIQSFKSPDRRTMRVVVVDGTLYQQEI